MTNRSIQLPIQTREASFVNTDTETRTAELIFSNGAPVRRYDYSRQEFYIEELAMGAENVRLDRLNAGGPVLDSHYAGSVRDQLGVVRSASVDGKQGVATVQFSARAEDSGIWQDIKDKIIRNVSVGYAVHQYDVIERDGELPIWRATSWEPYEISMVPIPADPGAQTRTEQLRVTDCKLTYSNRGKPMSDIRDEPKQETFTKEIPETRETPSFDERAVAARARAAEKQRQREIREVVSAAGFEDDMARGFVENDTPIDEVRKLVLDKLAERTAGGRQPTPFVQSGALDATETRRNGMIEAIVARATPGSDTPEIAREWRYRTLSQLAEEVLISEGVPGVKRMAPHQLVSRSMSTVSDFPNILANVLNKRLRQAYQENQPSYRVWARRAPNAPDFKSMTVVQMAGAPDLVAVPESGEFTSGYLSDGKETYSIVTYGRILPISRQAIVNDDLRAFDSIPRAFANAAARIENRVVYTQLTANANLSDGVALFHSTHANYTASGTAISDTSLGVARALMRKQKGLASEELNIAPRFLIVPATKEQLAYQYTSSQYVPATAATVNEFRQGGRTALEPVVDAYLDASSTTAWYLAADSSQADTVEYCYLDGAEGVYLESEVSFDTDGVRTKARLDFAAKVIDFRGLYKNVGA